MKNKITLIILIFIIIILLAVSIFFGINFTQNKNTIKQMEKSIENLNQQLESNKDNNISTTTENDNSNLPNSMVIPKFNSSNIDTSNIEGNIDSVEEEGHTISIGKADVSIGKTISSGSSSGLKTSTFNFEGNEYTFNGLNIVNAIHHFHGQGSQDYYAVLLEDGTVYYAVYTSGLDDKLNFEKLDIEDAVSIISLKTTQSGRILSRLGVITSDGVTHIIK